MYSRQKGVLPTLTFFGGFFMIAYFTIAIGVGIYYSVTNSTPPVLETIIRLLGVVIAFSVVIALGVGLVGMFPSIRIVKTGIKYKYLEFFGGTILWDEVDDLIELKWPRGCMAVVISRKGYSPINRRGLTLNSFYGRLIKHEQPVLLLSIGLENRDEVLGEIRKRSNVSDVPS